LTKENQLGRYNEYDNVVDYIEVKMLKLADKFADMNRLDIAEKLWNALDLYLDHKADIWFNKGEPVMRMRDGEKSDTKLNNKDDETSP
tara:strand:- start:99 stop:362 length:264 start_codon:yes stop_codon:yes gene_type:complete